LQKFLVDLNKKTTLRNFILSLFLGYLPLYQWYTYLVGNANNQSVLWCVVLVLVLDTKPFSGEVIGFTFSSSLKFWLEAFEVRLVLLNGTKGSLMTSTFGHFRIFLRVELGLKRVRKKELENIFFPKF